MVGNRRSGSLVWYVLALVCMFWGVGHWFNVRQQGALENISSYIMYPILVAQHAVIKPVKDFFERRKSQQELEALVKRLLDERDDLVAQNVQLNSMLSYANQTDELATFKKQFGIADAAIAQVLVKHFSENAQYFLIDKGAAAGMAPDMVAVYKNCLLGKVVEVYPRYSKVLLVTDKQCKVAAYCAHTHASGIHEGMNLENQTAMQYVSHLAEIEPDDLVLSSGDGLIFPKGFALGKISMCKPHGLFYSVTIQPFLDLRKIDYCFIMQKGMGQSPDAQAALVALCEQHQSGVNEKLSHIPEKKHEQQIMVTSQLELDGAATMTMQAEQEQAIVLQEHVQDAVHVQAKSAYVPMVLAADTNQNDLTQSATV